MVTRLYIWRALPVVPMHELVSAPDAMVVATVRTTR